MKKINELESKQKKNFFFGVLTIKVLEYLILNCYRVRLQLNTQIEERNEKEKKIKKKIKER